MNDSPAAASIFPRVISAAIAGGLLAGGLAAAASASAANSTIARFNLVPDLAAAGQAMPDAFLPVVILTGIAGAATALTLAALAELRNARSPARFLLIFANPVALAAFSGSAQESFLFLALVITASAILSLAASRDFRAAVLLGIALAVAPLISNSLLFLFPAFALLLPLISPWGLAPNRIAGFSVVIWSPFAMALIGLGYLRWLLGDFGDALTSPPPISAIFSAGYLTLATGALLVSGAARARGFVWPAFAFILGGALIAASRPDWLSLAL